MILLNNNEKQNKEMTNSTINDIEKKFCESEWIGIGGKKTSDARLRASKKFYERHKNELRQKARNKYKEKNEERIWTLPCPKCKMDRIFKSYRWYKTAIKTNTCCHNCKNPDTYVDLSGKKFNRLLVIKKLDRTRDKHLRWLCKCDCGNETIVPGRNLTHNFARSCGCYVLDKLRKRPFEWVFNSMKRTANITNRECNITYEEYVEFTKIKYCHYCYKEIPWKKYFTRGYKTAYYLDRKNNNMGYIKDNCVVCCSECNFLKSNKFSYEEMIKLGVVLKEIREGRIFHDV